MKSALFVFVHFCEDIMGSGMHESGVRVYM